MPTIRIEGEAQHCAAAAGETVLAALRRHGIALPASCEVGDCGTCKVQLVTGEVHELDYDPWALDDELRARGVVLACRSTVWSDIVIRRLRGLEPPRVLGARVVRWPASGALLLSVEAGEVTTTDSGCSVALEIGAGRTLDARIASVSGRDVACELSPAARALPEPARPGDVVVLRLRG